ncbi:NUDIX hydrolase [Microbispora bryophytorum]|uniref:NUDIX hydrolase n=1 Tax=Microbispora bryophytorum TaxID=1460882 RepID=UPI0033DD483F
MGSLRETLEQTGVLCEITDLVGTYTDPRRVILYTSDGEARQEFSIMLTARAVWGEPTPSSESSEVSWVSLDQVTGLRMGRSMRLRIGHYLTGSGLPYIG